MKRKNTAILLVAAAGLFSTVGCFRVDAIREGVTGGIEGAITAGFTSVTQAVLNAILPGE